MDWGAYVIVASITWAADTPAKEYRPATLFDQKACLVMALEMTTGFLRDGVEAHIRCELTALPEQAAIAGKPPS